MASGYTGNLSGFNSAMFAALNNPAGYDISYTYYINTAAFSSDVTFLQLGTFLNTGSSYYEQDYSTPNEISLNGTQCQSGLVYTGTVTINVGSVFPSDSGAASETFFRLGLVENSNNTTSGVGVYYTDISITPVPHLNQQLCPCAAWVWRPDGCSCAAAKPEGPVTTKISFQDL